MASQRETAMTEKALLFAVKNRKEEEAIDLLNREPPIDIHVPDKVTGKQLLHIAASNGSRKIVTKLLELGADVNCKDNNGDTPLHFAVNGQHEVVIALLVAFGCSLTSLKQSNKAGHTALSGAVQNKYPRIVDMLVKFGQAPCLSEWEWKIDSDLSKKENEIIQSISKQIAFLPGFKSGVIKSEVIYARPQQPYTSESLQLEIKTETISHPFVLQCYVMQYEYAKLKQHLKKDEDAITDLYELRTWDCREKSLTLLVTVNEPVRTGRQLKFISIEKSAGTVYQIDQSDDNGKTTLRVEINIKDKEYTKFTIATVEREEKLKISKSAVVLKPETHPGTEIAIPQNSFEDDLDVSLKVIDTGETNMDEEKFLVATDALAINTSDGIQPKNEVDLMIPVHSSIDSQNVVVLASKTDHPESVEDWEIVEPELSNNGSVSFKTGHFSLFVGVTKALALTDKGLNEIHEALDKTITRKKKVVFLVFAKEVPEEDSNLSVVVQCVLYRKQWAQREEWSKKGYKLINNSDSIICTLNSIFQISLSGNIEEVFRTSNIELEFHRSRENYRVFNVCLVNKDDKAKGEINIELQETKIEIVTIETPPTCNPFRKVTPATKEVEDIQITELCKLPFEHIVETIETIDVVEEKPIEMDSNSQAMILRKAFAGFQFLKKARQMTRHHTSDENDHGET